MNEFLQGILATSVFLGGLCGFIYWVFGLMEKRLELKIDSIATDVSRIADELREEKCFYKFRN